MKQSTVHLSPTQVRKMADYTVDTANPKESFGPVFWREAAPLYPSRNRKVVRLRLDPEIADWFASRKEDPHAGINAVLRAYVERRRADGQKRA